MGEVYRALDTELRRPVALKFLHAEVAGDEKRMSRFIQEARAASALNHPNILTVYEIGQSERGRFFATEFVEGVTLREYMASRQARLGEMIDISIQIASALVKAHAAGIVHRDIKPENVMLSADGYAKVLDFGLAKFTDAASSSVDAEAATRALVNTDPGAVMGTVSYMSPEQARAGEVDARTDVWSLGCVLYEMLTGHVPFELPEAATPSHRIVAILEKEPLPLKRYMPGVPPDLEHVVAEALTKDREERPTARQMLASLKKVKQRIDAGDEIERSVAPELLGGAAGSTASGVDSSGEHSSFGTAAQMTTARTSQASATTTAPAVSSAEYLVAEIKRHRRGVIIAFSLLGIVAAGVAFGLYRFFSQSQSTQPGALLKVTPLTSSTGVERNVAFSPDGKQIAFVSTEQGNFDIYVKIIGAGEPLRLTTNPARDMSPAFSPDGRYVAFLRGSGEGRGFYLIPALGGAERKLAEAYGWNQAGAVPQALDWSPDGKTLAVMDKTSAEEPWGIFLLSVETGEKRRLTQPPAQYNGDIRVAFSPDGSRLAFARTHDFTGEICTVPVAGGEPMRLTSDEMLISALAWMPDGASLVFSSERRGSSSTLWRVAASGGTPTLVAGVGENVYDISVSRQGERLAYAQLSTDSNIYRIEVAGQAGGRRSAGAPVNFISSTRIEQAPRYSPDGRRVAFASNRTGSTEIWVCDSEGQNPVQLTDFGGPLVSVNAPSWSPDGRFVAFDSRAGGNADIYLVSVDAGHPRRLTTDPSRETTPSWSRDGRWIYFTSNRTGRPEVWKMPTVGGEAVQVTRGGGSNPSESPDGRAVYYVRELNRPGDLWQVSVEGGEEAEAFEADVVPGNWAVAERGIYFLNRQTGASQYTLEFFDFATRRTTQIATLDGPIGTFLISGLTVSPDERRILYAQRDRLEFDLMLVENFR